MRTTISLDEQLGFAARRRAAAEGLSFSAYVARALRLALAHAQQPEDIPPFELITVSGGGPLAGVALDRTSSLLVAEDRARYGEE
jgi:hypothetical protein